MTTLARLIEDLSDQNQQKKLDALENLIADPPLRHSRELIESLFGNLGAQRKAVQRQTAAALAALARVKPGLVALLKEWLDSSDERTRWGAAYALGLMEEALTLECLPVLVEALGSEDGDKRWAAADLLVRLGRSHIGEVTRSLLNLEHSPNLNARKMMMYCLRDLCPGGSAIVQLACRQSLDADVHVRLAALSLLAKVDKGKCDAAEAILRCLSEDSDAGVRRSAASALGRLEHHDDKLVAQLRLAADTSDASLRKAARRSLKSLGYDDE